MTNSPSLDPLKTPWKRGDVVTKSFQKAGFVAAITPEYMEVRWNDAGGEGTYERIPVDEVDWLTRFAHADSVSPEGTRTNLQALESLESLDFLQRGIAERIKNMKGEKESEQLDRLVRRIVSQGECPWDLKHRELLTTLLASPKDVGVVFKFREWMHRFSCPIK